MRSRFLLGALLMMTACNTSPTVAAPATPRTPASVASLAPTATPPPSQATDFGVHLHFSGYLTGTMVALNRGGGMISSRPSSAGFEFPTKTRCGEWSDEYGSYWQADIVGDVAGGHWALSLSYQTNNAKPGIFHIYGKPGSNDADADTWLVPSTFPNDTTSWYATFGASGTFTVEPDKQHGSIDLILPEGPTGLGHDIHVTGLWRCN